MAVVSLFGALVLKSVGSLTTDNGLPTPSGRDLWTLVHGGLIGMVSGPVYIRSRMIGQSEQPWIEAGYRIFALAGPDAIRIEQLAREPSRFAELASTYSACPSREAGGSLGQLTAGSTVPEFERALTAMSEGDLSSQPVRSRYGFHVIKLHRRILGRRLPFEAARDRIALHLQAASWSRAVSQLIGVLAGRANIEGVTLNAMPHQSCERG